MTDDGVRVWYETMGEGVPIVLIAGGPGGNSESFRKTHMLLRGVGKEEVLGILALGPRAGGRGYSKDERRRLAEFGALAGKAIYHLQFANHREAVRQQRDRGST